MKLSTSTNMVFERINMEPISQERGILLCVQAGYRVFDFCFHDLITFKSPFLDERWEAYTEKMCALKEEHGLSYEQGHANVYDFLNPKADHEFHQTIMERCVLASEKWGFPGLWFILYAFSADAVYAASRSGNTEYLSVSASLPQSTAWESRWKICGICILRLNAIMRIMQRSCVSSQTRWAQKYRHLLGLGACQHHGAGSEKISENHRKPPEGHPCVRPDRRGQYPCNAFPGKNRLEGCHGRTGRDWI